MRKLIFVSIVLAIACNDIEPEPAPEKVTVAALEAAPAPECSNGIDDDDDQKVDFPADWGCDSANDGSELGGILQPELHECGSDFTADGDDLSRVLHSWVHVLDTGPASRAAAIAKCEDDSNWTARGHSCSGWCPGTAPADRCSMYIDLEDFIVLRPCECWRIPIYSREPPLEIVGFHWECERFGLLAAGSPMSCSTCLPVAPPPREVRQ